MLSRIYSAPGGPEALDVLMKFMYGVISSSISRCLPLQPIGNKFC